MTFEIEKLNNNWPPPKFPPTNPRWCRLRGLDWQFQGPETEWPTVAMPVAWWVDALRNDTAVALSRVLADLVCQPGVVQDRHRQKFKMGFLKLAAALTSPCPLILREDALPIGLFQAKVGFAKQDWMDWIGKTLPACVPPGVGDTDVPCLAAFAAGNAISAATAILSHLPAIPSQH